MYGLGLSAQVFVLWFSILHSREFRFFPSHTVSVSFPMKTLFFGALLFSIAFNTPAQGGVNDTPQDTAFSISQRGGNENIWQRTTYEQLPSGDWIPHLHSYAEVA